MTVDSHQCGDTCEELRQFVGRFAHDLIAQLDAAVYAKGERATQEIFHARQLLLSLFYSSRVSIDPFLRPFDHAALDGCLRRAVAGFDEVLIGSCPRHSFTTRADAQLIDLLIWSMVREGAKSRYRNTRLLLQCDCGTGPLKISVTYYGDPADGAASRVPHLGVMYSTSSRDIGISLGTARLLAAAHGGTIRVDSSDRTHTIRFAMDGTS